VVRAIKARARAGGLCGAIIAAFGDPGLEAARALGLTRVVGLGEAGIRAAGQSGRRFSIITLGAAMQELIQTRVETLGLGAQLAQVHVLPFSIADMFADRNAAHAQIVAAARRCPGDAALLGGAPFAGMAQKVGREAGKLVLDGIEACLRAIATD
jgi:allantoin racemase